MMIIIMFGVNYLLLYLFVMSVELVLSASNNIVLSPSLSTTAQLSDSLVTKKGEESSSKKWLTWI